MTRARRAATERRLVQINLEQVQTMKGLVVLVALWLFPTTPQTVTGGAGTAAAGDMRTTSDPLDEVWAREEEYWRLVAAGDVAGYLNLWHPDFRGWPCASEHPATKTTIGDWVKEIRDQRITFSYRLQREGGTVVGGVVVVYYRTPLIYRYPDGRVIGETTAKKFTHTWMKTDGAWRIIGGMCGADAPR